jgi:hypothetical protein
MGRIVIQSSRRYRASPELNFKLRHYPRDATFAPSQFLCEVFPALALPPHSMRRTRTIRSAV